MTRNTRAMESLKVYDALLNAILENKPERFVKRLAVDTIDCPESAGEFERQIQKAIDEAKKDAENYYPHYQNGKPRPVLKKSPLGRKLSKGAFNPSEEV